MYFLIQKKKKLILFHRKTSLYLQIDKSEEVTEKEDRENDLVISFTRFRLYYQNIYICIFPVLSTHRKTKFIGV